MLKKNKLVYYCLIFTFTLLYLLIAVVSTIHAIDFFKIGNMSALAILLGVAFETGQSSVLFAILMSENRKTSLAWFTMFLLTSVQISANIFASFKHIDQSGTNDWTYWQRSILFWVQEDSTEMYKVIIAWIQGAILPIVALALTSLVADNIRIMRENKSLEEEIKTGENKEVIDVVNEEEKNNITDELIPYNTNNNIFIEDLDELDKLNKPKETVDEVKNIPEIALKLETKKVDEQPRLLKKNKKAKYKPVPVNKVKGWHLLKEFVDDEFNVFNKGVFKENDPSKIPTSSLKKE